MIAIMLALGLLDPPSGAATGTLLAAADQVAAVQIIPVVAASGNALPLNAPPWPRPFDPADRAPYAFDFGPVLGGSSAIAYLERFTMSAAGAAAGVEIDQQAPRLPVIAQDGTHAQVWFLRCSAASPPPLCHDMTTTPPMRSSPPPGCARSPIAPTCGTLPA